MVELSQCSTLALGCMVVAVCVLMLAVMVKDCVSLGLISTPLCHEERLWIVPGIAYFDVIEVSFHSLYWSV